MKSSRPHSCPATRGGRLVAVDAAGHPLPFDPERTGLDLPVVATADAGVVGVLAVVQAVDPALFQRITGARGSEARRRPARVRRPSRGAAARCRAEVIRAVALVGQDLASLGRPYAELDARFAGQVVVRQRHAGATRGRA